MVESVEQPFLAPLRRVRGEHLRRREISGRVYVAIESGPAKDVVVLHTSANQKRRSRLLEDGRPAGLPATIYSLTAMHVPFWQNKMFKEK